MRLTVVASCTSAHACIAMQQGVDPTRPPVALEQVFQASGTVEGSIAIRNLADMLESDTELTRYTAAKVSWSIARQVGF